MEWTFEKYRAESVKEDSQADKFFADQAQFDALVREAIQNSLDAVKDPSQPVSVSFRYRSVAPEDFGLLGLDQYKNHLESIPGKSIDLTKHITALVIEDFNTVGLSGDNLEGFLYQVNITPKDRGGGSHGIGKVTLNKFSKIKACYAYSEFDESGFVFAGFACLKSHKVGDCHYRPHGRSRMERSESLGFIRKLFTRKEGDAGLSVAIIDPVEEINYERVLGVVSDQFYVPILEGKLIVRIDDEAIDHDLLRNACGEHAGVSLYSQYLDRDCLQLGNEQVSRKEYYAVGGAKSATNVCDNIKDRVQCDEIEGLLPVAVDLKIELPIADESGRSGECTLILGHHPPDADGREPQFWRDWTLISKASGSYHYMMPSGFYSILACRDNPLANLMRKLEDPGHTSWQTGDLSDDLKFIYDKKGDVYSLTEMVKMIKSLPKSLAKIYERQTEVEYDRNKLSWLFPRPGSTSNSPAGQPGRPAGFIPGIIPDLPLPSDFDYSSTNDGFSLSLKERDVEKYPKTVEVRAAYSLGAGDPFREYEKDDFLFSNNIELKHYDAEQLDCGDNSVRYKAAGPKFKLQMSGFDPERELKIDAKILAD